MKKVGLFFGTFNPVHVGHLIIANHIVEHTEIEEVWMIVSPHNPLKEKAGLLADEHRLELMRRAVADNDKLHASDIEFDMPQPSYTAHTLARIHEQFPDIEPVLIMGEDNLRTLHKWFQCETILKENAIYYYPRVQTIQKLASTPAKKPEDYTARPNVHLVDAPILKLSATAIRKAISEERDVRYLLTEPVYSYVKEMKFYK